MPDDNDTNAGGVLDGIDPSALAEDEKAPDEKTPQAEGTDAAADAEGGKDEQPPEAASGATDGEQEPAESAAEGEGGDETVEGEADGDGATKDSAAPATPPGESKPAPAVSPPPAPDPQAAERQARDTRYQAVKGEISTLRLKLKNDRDNWDPYTDGPKLSELQLEAEDIREQMYSEQIEAANLRARTVELEAQERQFWGDYAKQHPLIGERAQAIYQEEFDKTRAEYPKHSTDAVQLLATERLKHRVATIEGVKRGENAENKPRPRAATPPAANKGTTTQPAPGSGRLVPPGAAGRVAKPVTAEDQLAAAVGGSIKSLLA